MADNDGDDEPVVIANDDGDDEPVEPVASRTRSRLNTPNTSSVVDESDDDSSIEEERPVLNESDNHSDESDESSVVVPVASNPEHNLDELMQKHIMTDEDKACSHCLEDIDIGEVIYLCPA